MSKPTLSEVAAVVRVYLYAAISTASALWLNGIHDWKAIGLAALSAALAPVTQVLNPKDPSAGLGAKKRQ